MKIHHKLLLLALLPMAFYLYSAVVSLHQIYQTSTVTTAMGDTCQNLSKLSELLDAVQDERRATASTIFSARAPESLTAQYQRTDRLLATAAGQQKAELAAALQKLRGTSPLPQHASELMEGYSALIAQQLATYSAEVNTPTTRGVGKLYLSMALLEQARENLDRMQCDLSLVAYEDKPLERANRRVIIKARELAEADLDSALPALSSASQQHLKALARSEDWTRLVQFYQTVIERAPTGKYGLQASAIALCGDAQVAALSKFLDREMQGLQQRLQDYRREAEGEVAFQVGFFIVSLLLVIFVTWLLARNINRSLHAATEVAEAVSHGDFSKSAPVASRDEIGALMGALNQMTANLRGTAELAHAIAGGDLTRQVRLSGDSDVLGKALQEMVQGLQTMVAEIRDTGVQIKSSSLQVSESSDHLSQGATKSAASLEEITSSVEEIGAQSQNNAENARQASQLAGASRDAAERGSARMTEMTAAMQEIITSQQQISKIIKTIDDIAFQTNLLALNAAVEAARAGMHGKGFAVVAQEVRNLAARSAKAARETAQLIESSNAKVSNGAQIATQTTVVFHEIEESIRHAASLVEEIAAASNEQAIGVQQSSVGLNQISEVTQQVTASAEQTAASAEELSQLSLLLERLLQRFRLAAAPLPDRETRLLQPAGESAMEMGWGGAPALTVTAPKALPLTPQPAAGAGDLIRWSEKFSVGVRQMDEQHKVLIAIINKLYAALKNGKANHVQGELLAELLDYTKTHFSREEAALRLAKYPGLAQQEKLHRGFEAKIAEFQQKFEEGKSLGVEAMQFLKDWLLNHIQKTDKQYESYLGDRF